MYAYRHTNGQIIERSNYVVDHHGPGDYFMGPFVEDWWYEPEGYLGIYARAKHEIKWMVQQAKKRIAESSTTPSELEA